MVVYADKGVDGTSLKHLIHSLRQELDPGIKIKRLDAKSLIEKNWEKETQLFIMPGGRDVFYQAALVGKGTDKIRSYVEQQGNYLGICAGAYFACARIEFEKGTSLELLDKRSLRFFPGVAKLPQKPPAIIEIAHGGGKVLLSGVHFEYLPNLLDPKDPYLSLIHPNLEKANTSRKEMFCDLLKK